MREAGGRRTSDQEGLVPPSPRLHQEFPVSSFDPHHGVWRIAICSDECLLPLAMASCHPSTLSLVVPDTEPACNYRYPETVQEDTRTCFGLRSGSKHAGQSELSAVGYL